MKGQFRFHILFLTFSCLNRPVVAGGCDVRQMASGLCISRLAKRESKSRRRQKVIRHIPNSIDLKYFQIKFISVYKILSTVLSGSLQSLHSCQENILQLFKSNLMPESWNRIQNFFRVLQLSSIIQCFNISKIQKPHKLRSVE
jgi:hypothetical protein